MKAILLLSHGSKSLASQAEVAELGRRIAREGECAYVQHAYLDIAEPLFADAVKKADECIGTNPTPYPKLYGIKAYAYNKLKDSVNAKASFEKYFKMADTSLIGMGDYTTYASVLLKFPGNDSLAGTFIDKAVGLDTLEVNRVTYLKSIASSYEGQKSIKKPLIGIIKWF